MDQDNSLIKRISSVVGIIIHTLVLRHGDISTLNSAAYSTLLFHGAVRAIPAGQWQSCQALGMSPLQTANVILPYAFKRAPFFLFQ